MGSRIHVQPAAHRLPGLSDPRVVDVAVNHDVHICQPASLLKLQCGNVLWRGFIAPMQIHTQFAPAFPDVRSRLCVQVGTYVVCDGASVVGYYALASGVVTVDNAAGRFRRNMPNPIPVAVLARLAVDRDWQGHGLGRALFRDAARRVAQAADAIGIRGIVVHALSDEAKDFYVKLGFDPSPREPMTLR